MKEAAGVCGGRGQVMEKVRECGLKLSRDGDVGQSEDHRGRRCMAVEEVRFREQAVPPGMEYLRNWVGRHTPTQAYESTSKGWNGKPATTSRQSCSMRTSKTVEQRSVSG